MIKTASFPVIVDIVKSIRGAEKKPTWLFCSEKDSKKIFRSDQGLYSQYFPSYDIFCEEIRDPILNLVLRENKNLAITKDGITQKVL